MSYTPPSHTTIGPIKYVAKEWEQMTGKTLLRVDDEVIEGPWGNAFLVLRFSDGGAILLEANSDGDGYNGEPTELKDEGGSIGSSRILVHFGLLDEAEFHRRRSKEQQREISREEERERAELKRLQARYVMLKAKYGDV